MFFFIFYNRLGKLWFLGDVSEVSLFGQDLAGFPQVLTTFGVVLFCEDFCTLGCLDWPCLFETEVSFGVLFCEDFCTLGCLDWP